MYCGVMLSVYNQSTSLEYKQEIVSKQNAYQPGEYLGEHTYKHSTNNSSSFNNQREVRGVSAMHITVRQGKEMDASNLLCIAN